MYKTAIKIGSVFTFQLECEDFLAFFKQAELLGIASERSKDRRVVPFHREAKASGGCYIGFVDLDNGEELTIHQRKDNKGWYLTPDDVYRNWREPSYSQGEANTDPQDGPGDPPSDFGPEPQPSGGPSRPPQSRPGAQRQGPPRPPAGPARPTTQWGGR